ncbi:MAG: hypothetical protein J0M04_11460 [Verrucomicrobia bacterium]|nr:hypothetical protein [Verrucomicrobiota bacterium]
MTKEKINAEFPGLDETRRREHGWGVQTILFKRVLGCLLAAAGFASAQGAGDAPLAPNAQAQAANAPPQVVASAVAAVEKLGMDVTKGDFKIAIDRMNPEWMARLAKQTPGGREAIQKQIEGAAKRLAQEGVSIVSSVPMGQPRTFEVSPGKRLEKVNGQDVEVLVFTKWMVLVPTLTKYRMLLKGDPKPVFIEKIGFQVAVADNGKDNWTFIDGSNLTVSALRRVYPTLPKDMRLPPIEERQAK